MHVRPSFKAYHGKYDSRPDLILVEREDCKIPFPDRCQANHIIAGQGTKE